MINQRNILSDKARKCYEINKKVIQQAILKDTIPDIDEMCFMGDHPFASEEFRKEYWEILEQQY